MKDYKNDFPLLLEKDIAYLDSGATTQKPKSVIEALQSYYANSNANPHRGMYKLSMEATQLYDDARQKVVDFIGAKHFEEVIFTKNATEASNLVAYSYGLSNLSKGDEVVVSIMEHHSCIVPWQKITTDTDSQLKYMYIDENYRLTEEEIKTKITSKTKIVCISHISNVLGTINDVKTIIDYAHEKGAVVLVDASQSIPHMKVDVSALDADFMIFSGHKMLAPLGIGVLYAKREILQSMPPFIMGGDMIEYVYEQETTYAELPNKFEGGTQNIAGAIGLGAAIDYINSVGYSEIHRLDNKLLSYAREELSKLDFIKLYMNPNEREHACLISFNVEGVHPHDVSDILNTYGICVRAGNHCAQPLLRYLGLESTCRASFYLYNTTEDIDRLIMGLKKVYDIFGKYLNKNKKEDK